jgi:hypothetical protein
MGGVQGRPGLLGHELGSGDLGLVPDAAGDHVVLAGHRRLEPVSLSSNRMAMVAATDEVICTRPWSRWTMPDRIRLARCTTIPALSAAAAGSSSSALPARHHPARRYHAHAAG